MPRLYDLDNKSLEALTEEALLCLTENKPMQLSPRTVAELTTEVREHRRGHDRKWLSPNNHLILHYYCEVGLERWVDGRSKAKFPPPELSAAEPSYDKAGSPPGSPRLPPQTGGINPYNGDEGFITGLWIDVRGMVPPLVEGGYGHEDIEVTLTVADHPRAMIPGRFFATGTARLPSPVWVPNRQNWKVIIEAPIDCMGGTVHVGVEAVAPPRSL